MGPGGLLSQMSHVVLTPSFVPFQCLYLFDAFTVPGCSFSVQMIVFATQAGVHEFGDWCCIAGVGESKVVNETWKYECHTAATGSSANVCLFGFCEVLLRALLFFSI